MKSKIGLNTRYFVPRTSTRKFQRTRENECRRIEKKHRRAATIATSQLIGVEFRRRVSRVIGAISTNTAELRVRGYRVSPARARCKKKKKTHKP